MHRAGVVALDRSCMGRMMASEFTRCICVPVMTSKFTYGINVLAMIQKRSSLIMDEYCVVDGGEEQGLVAARTRSAVFDERFMRK